MTRMLWIGFQAICDRDVGCFQKLGVDTDRVPSFSQGLERVVADPPEVVVLALTGGAAALETQIRAIRQIAPDTFVAVCVAETHETRAALAAGADDVVALEVAGDLPCAPTLKWLSMGTGAGGESETRKLARRAGYLERKVQSLERRIETLSRRAAIDEPSGLVGRDGFIRHLDCAIAVSRRHAVTGLLCTIDLDGLDSVTEILGQHVIGGVLTQIGNALVSIARGTDVAARLGDERFAILMPAAAAQAAPDVVARVQSALATIALPKAQRIGAVVSIVVIEPDESSDARELLAQLEQRTARDDSSPLIRLKRRLGFTSVRDRNTDPAPTVEPDSFDPFL